MRISTAMVAVAMVAVCNVSAAATVPWQGTADYTAGTNGVTGADSVGPFDAYDLAVGAVLFKDQDPLSGGTPSNPVTGDIYDGYLQTYVNQHTLDGAGVSAPNLDTTGSGGVYELTAVAQFQEEVTGVDSSGNVSFDLTGGNFDLRLDGSPDYNFATDSGFSDGNSILSGTIVGGSGTVLGTGDIGVTSVDVLIDAYDTDIFSPDTIVAGSSVFTIQLDAGDLGVLQSVTSVGGFTYNSSAGDLLVAADGNLALSAVPVPAAAWLFGSALLGLFGLRRKRVTTAA